MKSSKPAKESKTWRMAFLPLGWISDEVMRNEAARVPGDRRGVFANADARGLLAHDPRADHRVVAVEPGQLVVSLPDEALLAVLAGRFHRACPGGDRYVGALPRVQRLLHQVGLEARRPLQRSMSFSWSELNWSASGYASFIQYHCTTLASRSAVGVSALYSSIFGTPLPSHERSKRP